MSKAFFDTNILVYQLEKIKIKKRDTCRKLVKEYVLQNEAVISTQVLQEYYVVTTSKLNIDPIVIKSIIHTFQNMEIVSIGTNHINEAIDTSLQYKISFWDSLIIVAAESAKCEVLYKEDLNHNQIIRNVRIINPLL